MGHYEDFWWDITTSIKDKGLNEEFNAQLRKMTNQSKHQYKDSRARWSYAYEKVIQHNLKK
tara:strand:+ start:3992 stop:4174 length:183 start_codon:yes stop_codon:yes gene_type:complete